jgi:hypothetical protein
LDLRVVHGQSELLPTESDHPTCNLSGKDSMASGKLVQDVRRKAT